MQMVFVMEPRGAIKPGTHGTMWLDAVALY
jgi:hypothetical protein